MKNYETDGMKWLMNFSSMFLALVFAGITLMFIVRIYVKYSIEETKQEIRSELKNVPNVPR